MLFSSDLFLYVFLPVVLLAYFIIHKKRNISNYFLLLASLFFYAWGEPLYVFLMIGSIVANYLFGRFVNGSLGTRKKLFLIASVVFNLGVLFCFKYMNFAVETVNSLFNTGFSVVNVTLPIGISFFTFQAMSYVIDVYRGNANVQKNILYLGLYISFFPQLIAGPIVRYSTIEKQIENRTVDFEKFEQGIYRFIQGFAKKVIIANTMSITADKVFALAEESELSVSMAWLGALAYTFQIFFDFSGYSDMAIGLGKMFGFEFEENFRYPYISKSVSEFWNRWHISLGRWFRDYVYFPLGGSRVSKPKLIRNLFVVWLLTGIWHGADWRFIVWGVGYGVLISFEKLTGIPKKFKSKPLTVLYSVFTFLTVVFGWVLFGANSFSGALSQMGSMIGLGGAALFDKSAEFCLNEYWLCFGAAAILSTPLIEKISERLQMKKIYRFSKPILYLALLVLAASYMALETHNPFIYFNF